MNYENSLLNDSRNLTEVLVKDRTLAPMYREQEVAEAVMAIENCQSVLFVGPVRCGKTSTIYGVAEALESTDKQLLELTSSSIMVGTRYLGEWQSKLQSYIDSAKKLNAVLYFVDIENLLTVGKSSSDKTSAVDFLSTLITNKEITVVGEVSPETYKSMLRTKGFAELFHCINLQLLTEAQVDHIVELKASSILGQSMDNNCHIHLKDLTSNFAPPDSGPGTRLKLLQRIQSYSQEKAAIDELEPIDTAFIDKVFSIYSGLPIFVFSRNRTVSASDIRGWFRKKIFGQEQAIEAVVESLTLFKSALRDPNQPIGTFLFTGPTGVGKTELTKALAEYLYGSSQRLLRFDMSEFASYDSFKMLIGEGRANSSALLIDPVRVQPFQVILFDEIEKGHQNIFDLLLQLLDEGRLTQPNGQTVDFRNTIIICTTNAGASEMSRPTPGFTNEGSQSVPMHVLERYFRPEFLNRFQHVLVFHPLSQSHVRQIAQGEVKKILKRGGIVSRNLIVDIDDSVLDAVVRNGYSDRYGARALKREVQRRLALPIASYLMENNSADGSLITVTSVDERTIVKGFSSNENEKPVKPSARIKPEPAQVNISATIDALQGHAEYVQKIEQALDVQMLRKELAAIDKSKDTGDFWQNRDTAMQKLKHAESINEKLNRVERLSNRIEELQNSLHRTPSREQISYTENARIALAADIECSELELLVFGYQYNHAVHVLVEPVSESSLSRDELYELYFAWCRDTNRDWTMLYEPQNNEDPAMFTISGRYAFGYLFGEAGLHRHRNGEVHAAARVTVAPAIAEDDDAPKPVLGRQQALKQIGQYGGKIRSFVEIQSAGITLQNKHSIVENREIAADMQASWQRSKTGIDVIRRYDAVPFLVKDYASEISSGRRDMLRGDGFTRLLTARAKLLIKS